MKIEVKGDLTKAVAKLNRCIKLYYFSRKDIKEKTVKQGNSDKNARKRTKSQAIFNYNAKNFEKRMEMWMPNVNKKLMRKKFAQR